MGDNNGYGGSDFKRNPQDSQDGDHDGDSSLHPKAGEYMREILSEKNKLDQLKFPISTKLLDQEITKTQTVGRAPPKENKYVDIYRERHVKVTIKVLVPVREHPGFNFVGKLLGPKGNSLKRLQEETMCKMAVLGRGSMRDKQKEEELRQSLDPKFAHLSDELHVEISTIGPPAEAHARIAYALAEVRKFLIPDANDMIRQGQLRELVVSDYGRPGAPPGRRPVAPPAPPMGVGAPRVMPAKTKIMSILDRARAAMEESYTYEDSYAHEPPVPHVRGAARGAEPDYYNYERHAPAATSFYEDDYYKEEPYKEYKVSSRDVGSRRGAAASAPPRHYPARDAPYSRPAKSASRKHAY